MLLQSIKNIIDDSTTDNYTCDTKIHFSLHHLNRFIGFTLESSLYDMLHISYKTSFY